MIQVFVSTNLTIFKQLEPISIMPIGKEAEKYFDYFFFSSFIWREYFWLFYWKQKDTNFHKTKNRREIHKAHRFKTHDRRLYGPLLLLFFLSLWNRTINKPHIQLDIFEANKTIKKKHFAIVISNHVKK